MHQSENIKNQINHYKEQRRVLMTNSTDKQTIEKQTNEKQTFEWLTVEK